MHLGGYAWLCRQADAYQYEFGTRAHNDAYVGYFPKEALFDRVWSCGVDVYALGMMIIHFLTSEPPFHEKGSKEAILQAIKNVPILFVHFPVGRDSARTQEFENR